MIPLLLLGLTHAYFVWCLVRLEVNVRKARALKVPVVRIPFDLNNYVWVIVQPLLWTVLARVPVPWSSYPDFVRFSHRNCYFLEKSSPATRFGSVWALVSPGGVHLQVSDPDAIHDICSRWRDFPRPIQMYKMLTVFGPSVFTVDLQDWPRHRKAVGAPFNETIMKLVWDESLRQAQPLVHYWTSKSEAGITGMQEDMRNITLNVLAATAFRESYDFIGSTIHQDRKAGTESYRDALFVVLKYSIHLMLIPYRFLNGPMVPRSLARIGRAAASLKASMMKMVLAESAALSQGKPGSGGVITHLVRALDRKTAQRTGSGDDVKKAWKGGLSDDEILGNIFVVNFAGFDTTSITLSFAMMLLAAHPEVQEWLHEEISSVTQSRPVDNWDYTLFSRLKRCQAVFLETLRVYSPVTGLPKMSNKEVQALRVGDQVLAIPSDSEIYLMVLCVQTDPRYWDEPYVWRPSRWIVHPGAGDGAEAIEEELFVPRKGSFIPWADGPQGCVGKKFALVEGAAILACLFRSHRVRLKKEAGETEEQVRKRAQDCANDVNYQLMLRMNYVNQVKLECVKV